MKLIVEKTTFFMSLAIIVILLFLWPLTGLDRVSAQSGGQTGQTLGLGGLSGLGGLGGLGLGSMMLGLGYNMAGTGGSLGLINTLGLGFPMGGSGSIGMLGTTNSGMIGGVYGGSGLNGMYGGMSGGLFGMYGGMYGGLFGMYGGMSGGLFGMSGGLYGMYGGMYGMYGGMYGMYGGMYGGLFGMYGGIYSPYSGLSPYSALSSAQSYLLGGTRQGQSNIAGGTIVPYFYGTGGSLYTPPLPYGITLHIDVVGYVYDADLTYLPLEGVTVTTKNSSTGYSVKTGYSGRFIIELFPDRYTLVFKKDGYQDTEREIRVMAGMDSIFVHMQKETINREPVLDISYIEVIAGDDITLDPDALVTDPDGDPLTTFSFSGWKSEYWKAGLTYTTTEADIGLRKVQITFSDGKSPNIIKDLEINILPGYEIVLYEGFNLISYPFENGDPDFSAFDLMETLGGFPLIGSIAYYDNPNDQYITAWYDSNGNPEGDEDFPIRIGQGYIIYVNEDITKKVINRYNGEDYDLELYQGINLVGIASRPEGYTSYELLLELNGYYVDSIYRYDPLWGDWESSYWLNGNPAGDFFPILMGEGYHIQIKEIN